MVVVGDWIICCCNDYFVDVDNGICGMVFEMCL